MAQPTAVGDYCQGPFTALTLVAAFWYAHPGPSQVLWLVLRDDRYTAQLGLLAGLSREAVES